MSYPIISVIVPVYNAESTIRRCVDSILAQTFTDFECLLIDDGSKDRSGEICDEYLEKDSRVRAFHKENGGVSSARNYGLSLAEGKYIVFVDADDYVPLNAFTSFLDTPESDLVIANAVCFPQSLFQLDWPSLMVYSDSIGDFLSINFNSPLLNGPWSKLFRKEIIEVFQLRFDEMLHFGEDSVFVKEYVQHVASISLCRDVCYEYHDNPGDFYNKYSLKYEGIYRYFKRTYTLIQQIECRFSCKLRMKNTIHEVYNLTVEYLKKSALCDSGLRCAKEFLSESIVIEYLKSCNARGMNFFLFLAKYTPVFFLPLGARLVSFLNYLKNRF